MKLGEKSKRWFWLWGVAASLIMAMGGLNSRAYAQGIGETIKDSFELHGYLENQEIFRNENFIDDYNIASIRNRIDLQPSGALIEGMTLSSPGFGLPPLMQNGSINYFMELRPGYEGAYDLNPDRFGNSTTGFSGIGYSGFFTTPLNKGAGLALVNAFHFNPKRFKWLVARTFAFADPIDPNERFINYVNGVFFDPCVNCRDVQVPERDLRFERDDTNELYYPVREAYLDFRWDFLGSNLLRLGKQQIVWGKADFFRLQDIINPVDFSQHFFIEPFEDIRIPQLSLWLQHRFGDILGLQDVAGNFVWNFDQFQPVGLGQSGEPWAVNFGDQKRLFMFNNGLFDVAECTGGLASANCNPNNINFALKRENIPDWRLRNSGVGMKWDFQLPHPAIRFALTDYWGIRDIPTFRDATVNVLPAPFVPVTAFPFKNCAAAASNALVGTKVTLSNGLPVTVVNPSTLKLAKGFRPDYFIDNCTFGGGINIVYHKVNTLGLSADYFEPYTGVVVRVESSWTHNALVNDTNSLDLTSNNDILQYVVGFDRPHFIKFLNPDRTFFSSFQVFETYYPGAHSTDGGKRGIITGVNDFTYTAFTQTHYYRDQIIPLVFAAFGSEGTDATIGGNTEWLINDHWSTTVGVDAFLGKSHQHDLGTFAQAQATGAGGYTPPARDASFSETAFGVAHMGAGGAQRNKDDEFWWRLRYRF
jgi:hypothetical protein